VTHRKTLGRYYTARGIETERRSRVGRGEFGRTRVADEDPWEDWAVTVTGEEVVGRAGGVSPADDHLLD